jgi:hypothetical protein
METAAFVALAVLAAAAFIQAAALAVLGFSLTRGVGRVDEAVTSILELMTPTMMRLRRTIADLEGATRLAVREAARTQTALEATRYEAEQATHHGARDAHDMALSLREIAHVTRSIEEGLEAYREARPIATRPWHRAIDAGLAAYRSAKLAS